MNQGMIGKFLAEERKHAKYTQKQLADILNLSEIKAGNKKAQCFHTALKFVDR